MNYHKITKASVVDGTGFRVVLWLSGCAHKCPGCHNPETWDPNSGKPFDEAAKQELFTALDNPYIQGITFSGGDPLHDYNCEDVMNLILEIKSTYPHKNIWLYTGYTKEELAQDSNLWRQLVVLNCDTIVEGRYIEAQRDITLPFRGSHNQRIITNTEEIWESSQE